MTQIETRNLFFKYSQDGEFIIKDINLNIEQGDFIAVLGHNGSGKSTFAKHLNAILTPTEGEVIINGSNTNEEQNLYEIRKTIGMVFQNPDNQIIATVVEEDVAFALENLSVAPDEIRKTVDETLEMVGMDGFQKHATHQLSGGQKQRVAIAGIIAMRPKILILDEPTAMLDPRGRKDVMNIIKKFNDEGITIILITHYMNEAAQAKRVVVMNDGEILIEGTPEYVFQNAGLLKSIGLDVPQSTELMFMLREKGIKVPLSVLTEDDCISVIEELLNKKEEKI